MTLGHLFSMVTCLDVSLGRNFIYDSLDISGHYNIVGHSIEHAWIPK